MSYQLPKLIGLTGFARSGKDTVAQVLHNHYGYTQSAIADPIKQIVYATNDEIAFLVDEVGWEKAKNDIYVREALQTMGSVLRDAFGTKFLLRNAIARVSLSSETRIVISDVRTQDEADAIHLSNGFVVRINKPGVGPVNNDITEQLLESDFTVVNDGSMEDLLYSVDEMFELIKKQERN